MMKLVKRQNEQAVSFCNEVKSEIGCNFICKMGCNIALFK